MNRDINRQRCFLPSNIILVSETQYQCISQHSRHTDKFDQLCIVFRHHSVQKRCWYVQAADILVRLRFYPCLTPVENRLSQPPKICYQFEKGKGPTLISVVLLSSPFWVAWLAVILNQQGGLSGAEGSAEGEVCVCLFEALSFFVHICLVVLRIHI